MVLSKRKAVALSLSLALLFSVGAVTLQTGFCLSSDLHVYDDTAVYDRDGRGVNVTITLDSPENKANYSTLAFTLKVAPYYGYPSDYSVSRESLGFYLIYGVILDYDRARVIDTLWINWGDSRNKTHVEEERLLFLRSHDAVLSKSGDTYYGSAVLPELSEGSHNLTVWVRAEHDEVTWYIPLWAAFSKTITFTVDTIAPSVLVLSPENSTYKASKASLNFTINEPFSEVAYCLDGQENMTISGNTTLTELPNGDHNVTVYATDEAGNTGASETVFFIVDAPAPFPTTLVTAASIAIVAVVGASLLVYFRKRRRQAFTA